MCWIKMCKIGNGIDCGKSMFDCGCYIDCIVDFFWGVNLINYCNMVVDGGFFNYGIYKNVIIIKIVSYMMFFFKIYFYFLWVGLFFLRYSFVFLVFFF